MNDLPTAAFHRIRPAFSRRFAGAWLIVAVNALLVALYFWSRGGGVITVRVEASGSAYRAYVDGKLLAEASFPGRTTGGIGFHLAEDGRIPSLPGPSGIDAVRVTDSEGGVLFEDSFDGDLSPLWQDSGRTWRTHDGVFSTSMRGTVTTGFQPWGDYVVEAKLRNVPDARVYVRAKDSGNAVFFSLRPFRHFDTSLRLVEDGQTVAQEGGKGVEANRTETVRSMIAMLLRPYPTLLALVVGAVLVALVISSRELETWLAALGRLITKAAHPIVAAIAVAAFGVLLYLIYAIGDHMPHVPDSVGYIFQAKIFSSFRLFAPEPPFRESFSYFYPKMTLVVDGRWFTQYPFGHPILLAIGERVGAVWLVPPVIGAACVVLTFFVGRYMYSTAVGLIAAFVLFFSPFFQMTASNFMAHSTGAFYILACLFFLTRPTGHRALSLFAAGAFLGLLFNTRPLPGVAFIPPLGLLMGYELLKAGEARGKLFREYLAFAAGALLLLLLYFLYNRATTGSFTDTGYSLSHTYGADRFGFGGGHSVARGLQNEQTQLAFLLLVANGWPLAIGLLFAALPFVLGSRNRWDYFLLLSGLAMAAGPIFYVNSAVMHGPRYWYEAMPFLVLLTARGGQYLIAAAPSAASSIAARLRLTIAAPGAGATALAVYALITALIVFSAYGWMLGKRDAWHGITYVPQKISLLEGFNGADDRLIRRVEELDVHNALVLVGKCPHWQCYGTVFWKNSPDLDGDVVYARDTETEETDELIRYFSDRSLYRADHREGTLELVREAAR